MRLPKLSILLLIIVGFLNIQCLDDEGNSLPQSACNEFAIIDSSTYQSAVTNPYTINSAIINGECLLINISASGCDGNSWIMQLIDSGEVSESSPPQRSVKLFLINNESCLAIVSRLQSFDLSALQIDGENELLLKIVGVEDPILYSY